MNSSRSEQRYFPEEEPGLTSLLDGFLGTLRDDLAARPLARTVRSLMLAGGYGRGEGGYIENTKPQRHISITILSFS